MTGHDRSQMIKKPADTPAIGPPHAKWARTSIHVPPTACRWQRGEAHRAHIWVDTISGACRGTQIAQFGYGFPAGQCQQRLHAYRRLGAPCARLGCEGLSAQTSWFCTVAGLLSWVALLSWAPLAAWRRLSCAGSAGARRRRALQATPWHRIVRGLAGVTGDRADPIRRCSAPATRLEAATGGPARRAATARFPRAPGRRRPGR